MIQKIKSKPVGEKREKIKMKHTPLLTILKTKQAKPNPIIANNEAKRMATKPLACYLNKNL